MLGRAEKEDEENLHRKVIFHPSVVPSASELKVDKVYYPEFHYDEFRGLYYINARDIGIHSSKESVIEEKPHEELEWHFDEVRQKWYYEADNLVPESDSDDKDDGLMLAEEEVVVPIKDIKSDAVSVTSHGVFSPKVKSKKQDEEKNLVSSSELKLTSI